MYLQRRSNPSGHKCCHHSSSNSVNFLHSNISSSHRYSSQPKTVWTVPLETSLVKTSLDGSLVQADPIYEDISEVKRKTVDSSTTKPSAKDNSKDNCKEVVTSSQGSQMKQSPSVSSSVLYGVITAKEVARFVPCNDVDIGR